MVSIVARPAIFTILTIIVNCTKEIIRVNNPPSITTINKDDKFVTLIEVFTVELAHQERLLILLTHATRDSVSNFASASLRRSLEDEKVTMYAQ